MASYHLTVKTHSRSKNANAVALASYRSGERLWDEKWQCYKNCRNSSKSQILHNELFNSQLMNREQLWNAAEKAERRKNSVVAKEIEIALPIDVSNVQKVSLARDFANYLASRYNCAVDLAVHAPDADGDHRNYHAHILMTTRQIQEGHIGPKWRQLDQPEGKGRMEIKNLRKEFENFQNKILEEQGSEERVFAGRAVEEDRPKKYRAIPFKKYQALRRTDRLEEFKEASSVEEFNRWKDRKDLEIEDFLKQINEIKKSEKVEQEQEQRREAYGIDGIEQGTGPGAVERREDSQGSEKETGNRYSFDRSARSREQEYDFGDRSNNSEGQYSDRSEEAWEGIKAGYRRIPEFVEEHVGRIRHELTAICTGHEDTCRELDQSIQQFNSESERQLNEVRRRLKQRIVEVNRRARESYQRAQQNLESLKQSAFGEQRRRAAGILRRRSYLGRIKRITAKLAGGCQKLREAVYKVSTFISGKAIGGFKRYLSHVIRPAFKGLKLNILEPPEIKEPVRLEEVRVEELPEIKNFVMPAVPLIDEKKRIEKLSSVLFREGELIGQYDLDCVNNIVEILKNNDMGRELIKDALEYGYPTNWKLERFIGSLGKQEKQILFSSLDILLSGGIKGLLKHMCPEIVQEVQGENRGKGVSW